MAKVKEVVEWEILGRKRKLLWIDTMLKDRKSEACQRNNAQTLKGNVLDISFMNIGHAKALCNRFPVSPVNKKYGKIS